MKVLSFDLKGKFAHFRKFYANNTALSYSAPPRTTIMGMLAAIIGRSRDTYYEELASSRIMISVQLLTPIKKSFHRLNFLSIKGSSDFRGANGRIQTPFEVITGQNLGQDDLAYRIFIASPVEQSDTFDNLLLKIESKHLTYNITLGTANFLASIVNVRVWNGVEKKASEEIIRFSSIINVGSIDELVFNDSDSRKLLLEEEIMPSDFKENHNREVVKMNRVIYSTTGSSFMAKISGSCYQLQYENEVINIQFFN